MIWPARRPPRPDRCPRRDGSPRIDPNSLPLEVPCSTSLSLARRPCRAHPTATAFALAVAVRLDPGIRWSDERRQSIRRPRERLEHSGVLECRPLWLHHLGLEFG